MRSRPRGPGFGRVLFLSAFVIATCGLVYELVAGAMASYLLGDSVTWFSFVIGTYLSAMGVGSWLSKYLERNLLARFVEIEVAVAVIGGLQAPLLFAGFVFSPSFRFLLLVLVFLIGTLVGLELPLLIRILEKESSLKDLVARVLFLDYIGALVASLAFPLVLVPQLGLFRTSLAFGVFNALVALCTTVVFDAAPAVVWRLRGMAIAAMVLLGGLLAGAGTLEKKLEVSLFADPVVFREVTPYQRIAVTHRGGDTRLYLNGALQFSSIDEYRYHEALVHPAMVSLSGPRRVLVMGGGDGLAVREILRHDSVEAVHLVDLDPAMTRIFGGRPELSELNAESFADPRVTVTNTDAFTWLQGQQQLPVGERYDVAIIDFPDPNDYGLGKLYTTHFYRMLGRVLADGGVFAVQSTSPMFSPTAFWCIAETIAHEGYTTRPYHAYVPSFGEWGFVLAGKGPGALAAFGALPEGLHFLDRPTLHGLFHFPPDMVVEDVPVNRLDNQALVRLYEEDWRDMLKR
jgi:spermidine synthase